MKKLILAVMVSSLILLIACAPATTSTPTPVESIPILKKITLEDAPGILNLSLLLPTRFEHLDAASEGMSKEDMELGSDCSEVQLFLSEDPFQMVYCVLMITSSRIEQASFDRGIEDEYQLEVLIENSLKEGATEQGFELTVPRIEITYPNIGDSAFLGEGYMESYGYQLGFDTLWFRSNTVAVFLYSMYMSSDNEPLLPIAQEIENRLNNYEH
jgi:hypothetical protein